jgi:hypothetical protein
MRIGIGIAVVVAIGLIWSVAVMSEWLPVVSADARPLTTNHPTPWVIRHTRRLRHTRSGRQRSLREISAELAARGFVAERTGRPFEAVQISRLLVESK